MKVKINFQSKKGLECLMEIKWKKSSQFLSEQFQEELFQLVSRQREETSLTSGQNAGQNLSVTPKLKQIIQDNSMLENPERSDGVVHFQVQLSKNEISEEMSNSSGTTDAHPVLPNSKILMVEDNPLNVFIGSKFLQKWGIELQVAENGKMALEMLENNPYDLILMDLQMPEMDGYEATRRIRQLKDAHKASIPILAISGANEQEVHDKVLEVGMNDFVFKPFNGEELEAKLVKYLLIRKAL